MSDTYDSAADAAADKAQQLSLLTALNGWDRALRRDECGAWRINGKYGSIHTWGDRDRKSWVLYVACRSGQHWTWTKKRLGFCTVTQDGDDEGRLRLHQLPTAEQAEVIRDCLGIRKRTELDADELERRRALGKLLALAAGRAGASTPAPHPPPDETREISPDPPLPALVDSDAD